jgi:hypothetical protein
LKSAAGWKDVIWDAGIKPSLEGPFTASKGSRSGSPGVHLETEKGADGRLKVKFVKGQRRRKSP